MISKARGKVEGSCNRKNGLCLSGVFNPVTEKISIFEFSKYREAFTLTLS